MAIYKHVLEAEKHLNEFMQDYLIGSKNIVDSITAALTNYSNISREIRLKKEIIARNLKNFSEGIEYMKTQAELFSETKISLKKMMSRDKLEDILNSMVHIKQKALVNNEYLEKIAGTMDGDDTPWGKEISSRIRTFNGAVVLHISNHFTKEIEKELTIDAKILSNPKLKRKDLLNLSHIHKSKVFLKLQGHKEIWLTCINTVDLDKAMIDNTPFHEALIEVCSSRISDPKCPDALEKEMIRLESMPTRDIEKASLDLMQNTALDVISQNPWVIRQSCDIMIRLVSRAQGSESKDDSQGRNLSKDPLFRNIVIQITLTKEFFYGIMKRLKALDKHSELYDTILHELTHAFDWKTNSPKRFDPKSLNNINSVDNERRIAQKYSNFAGQNSVKLARMLINMRKEALANMQSYMHNNNKVKTQISIPIEIHCQNEALEFVRIIHDMTEGKDMDASEIYESGMLHKLGFFMGTIMFLDRYRHGCAFFKDMDSQSPITQAQMDSVRFELHENGSLLWNEPVIWMFANPEEFRAELKDFINKLSLMPADEFLERYLESCRRLKLASFIRKEDFASVDKIESEPPF